MGELGIPLTDHASEPEIDHILDSLQKNQFHWEEQLWWMIAA